MPIWGDGAMAKLAVMNDTKWDEMRLGMGQLGDLSPQWRALDAESGHLSDWDGDWFHHFRQEDLPPKFRTRESENGYVSKLDGEWRKWVKGDGYSNIEWVELRISTETQRRAVLDVLRAVHVPGFETEEGYRVVGHIEAGQPLEYL